MLEEEEEQNNAIAVDIWKHAARAEAPLKHGVSAFTLQTWASRLRNRKYVEVSLKNDAQ